MNSVQDFLAFLSELDVKLWLDADNLRCNAPEGIMTFSLKKTLRERKKEIIHVLSKRNVFKVDDSSIIPLLSDKHDLPLSFAQQRLFFIDRLVPGSPLYNISHAIRIIGELNVDALRSGINEIIKRHEVLRTIFKVKDGQPMQVIKPVLTINMPVEYLGDLSEAEREIKAQRLVDQEAQKPFDLGEGPLLRAKLLQVTKQEHVLVLTMHHIITDGWSMGVFKRELSLLYIAFKADKPSPLPELPIQYGDFTVWQLQWLQGDVLDKQLAFWKKQLADLPVLQLPTDLRRPAQQTYRGTRYHFAIPSLLTGELRSLGRQQRCSSFMTLLAIFYVLLFRYTGQEDIAVGSPIAGRNRAELENLIGFFVNTLVLRVDLSGNPSFRELLTRVRNTAIDAFDHQDLPFEKIVAELRPEQDLSRNPLFQVMFVLQNAPKNDLQLENATVSPLVAANETAKFDLTVSFHDTGKRLLGHIEFNTDLFAEATMERLAGHFQTLVESIVENPDQSIAELSLLTAAEKQQLLIEWNDTKAEYPRDKCIHELFEEQVELAPDAVAVVYGDLSLTYDELTRHANQMAHFLLAHDISSGSFVGICMERSVEMIIGLLAILKAGGAYVPLDQEYPKERLDFMLEDADISMLLTQPAFSEKISGEELLIVHSNWQNNEFAHESEENPICVKKSDNLAYVIYTSGSTGTPKGVCVSHRAINRLVCNTNYMELKANDRVGQASNASFDAATFEIWGTLLNGGRLVGIAKETLLSPAMLSEVIRLQKISTLFLTTALFNQLAREMPDVFQPLSHLLFGGEAVNQKWVTEVLKAGGPARLLHVYGPTECTTFATWYHVKQVADKAVAIPIGKPISNTEVYILDKQQPVPIGIPGELYLGGDGLAQGYLNRPDLTFEKFVPNPFNNRPESFMYKTGDLVRYLPDGNIVFLDRIDQQVKIRGFRIELGEVESVLSKHPAIREVVVTSHADLSGAKRLVAYIVAKQEGEISTTELQRFLRAKLPNYMIPSVFMFLIRLPMTPNGKIDRRSLPPPVINNERVEKRYESPRNNLEIQLVKIWEDVLDTRPIGIKDNFFDLGGHSLLAMEIIDRIEKIFQKTLPVAMVFQCPTVELLGDVLRADGCTVPWTLIIPIRPNGSRPPFFFIHGNMANLASHIEIEQPIFSLMPHGMTGSRAPIDVEEMVQEYIKQIKATQPEGPYYIGGYSFGGILAIEAARLLKKQGQKISLLVLLDPTDLKGNKNTIGAQIVTKDTGIQDNNANSQKQQSERIFAYVNRVFNNFFSKQGLKEKSIYLLKGVTSRIDRRFGIKTKTKQIVCELYLRSGHRIPMALRRFYHSQASRKALRTYVPKVYSGNVFIFQSKNRAADFQVRWKRLIEGDMEFHELPCDHFDILKEPHVQVLAERLSNCIQKHTCNE